MTLVLNKYIKLLMAFFFVTLTIFLLPFIIRLTLPFLLGFLIAKCLQKAVKFLSKIGIKPGFAAAFFVLLIFGALIFGVWSLFHKIFVEAANLFNDLPRIFEDFNYQFNFFREKYLKFCDKLSPNTKMKFEVFASGSGATIENYLLEGVKKIANVAKNAASKLPQSVLFILITILSSFFMTKDYNIVKKFVEKLFSENVAAKMKKIKKSFSKILTSYLRAILILMCISFVEVFIGLSVLKIPYSLVITVTAAIADALPILGTGSVLIPLAFVYLIGHNYYLFTGILIIQLVCFLVRQLLEPKILSNQMGVHPLMVLFSIYVGVQTLGGKGLIAGPMIAFCTLGVVDCYHEEIFSESKIQMFESNR